jgi:hypothetical protein
VLNEILSFLNVIQTGLNLTSEQEKQLVLTFVQEAVEKFAPTETLKAPALKMQVDVNEPTEEKNFLHNYYK